MPPQDAPGESPGESPSQTGRGHDQPFAVLLQQVLIDAGARKDSASPHSAEMTDAGELDQISVTNCVLGQNHQVVTLLLLRLRVVDRAIDHVHLVADDRLEIRALAELEQLDGAVHDAVVCQGDGRHAQLLSPLHHRWKLRSPIQEAVIAVVMEGDKSHGLRLGPNARSSVHVEHNTLDLVLRAPGPPMDAPQTRWRPSRTDGQPEASGPPPTRCRSAAHRWAVRPG